MMQAIGVLTGIALAVSLLVSRPGLGAEGADDFLIQASRAAKSGASENAVELAGRAIAQNPSLAEAYYLRGRERFRLGQVGGSVTDFDTYVRLRPEAERRLWERGISYYYDDQYAKGAKQFELYQTYHDNDVENAVWRFLCVARTDGVKKARESMLPIKNDRRVPMMQIYDLYRGRLQPDDVLQAAGAGQPDEESLRRRRFYAHLYIGLFYEAHADDARSNEHIGMAADQFKIDHYMWDVAQVHAARLRGDDKTDSKGN